MTTDQRAYHATLAIELCTALTQNKPRVVVVSPMATESVTVCIEQYIVEYFRRSLCARGDIDIEGRASVEGKRYAS